MGLFTSLGSRQRKDTNVRWIEREKGREGSKKKKKGEKKVRRRRKKEEGAKKGVEPEFCVNS